MFLTWLDGLVSHDTVSGGIVGIGAIIPVHSHYAVALVGIESTQGLIDRYLLVVDAETMTVGIWVGEET